MPSFVPSSRTSSLKSSRNGSISLRSISADEEFRISVAIWGGYANVDHVQGLTW